MSKLYYSSFYSRGNTVYVRQVNLDGSRSNLKVQYKPKLYFKTEEPNCDYKTLFGDELFEVEFSDIKAAKSYAEASTNEIFGYPRYQYSCVDDMYPYEIEYNFEDLRMVYIDIETKCDTHYSTVRNPDQPVVLIQISYKNKYYVFGLDHYESYEEDVIFIRCKNEEDMLRKFVAFFRKIDPDIISGWYSQGFDIPYLYARMELLELSDLFKKLSPYNHVDTREQLVFGKSQLRVDIQGIQHLDMMELFKKFELQKFENYKLNTVAKSVLGKSKVPYQGNLHQLMVTDYDNYVAYGVQDVRLLVELEDTKNFIRMVVDSAYMDKANYIDAFSQVRMWDNQIMTYLKHNDNIQVPYLIAKDNDDFEESDEKFEGAFVYPTKVGKHHWILSDDVQSMHPSIIMSFNVSPETYIGNKKIRINSFADVDVKLSRELKDNNVTMLANGAMFSREVEGVIPKIIRRVFNLRVENKNLSKKYDKMSDEATDEIEKKKYYKLSIIHDSKQYSQKIKINSLFGFLGNLYSRFFQLDMAEGITVTSQLMQKSGTDAINRHIESVTGIKDSIAAGDTDSVYYSMQSIVDKYVLKGTPKEKICDFLVKYHTTYIAPALADEMDKIQTVLNTREKSIRFVRDVVSDVSIFVAKKKYMMSILNKEGKSYYNKQELKITGIESIKTTTPEFCRGVINELIPMFLFKTNDEFISEYQKAVSGFYKLTPEEISIPTGVSDVDKYTVDTVIDSYFDNDDVVETIMHKKGSPVYCKASVYYNKLLLDKSLTNWYQKIENGDKIKFVYLKSPNPIKNNVVAYLDKLPLEFGLHKYVDYDIMLEKTLEKPIKRIADILNWKLEFDNAMF